MLKGIFDLQASLHNKPWLITKEGHKAFEGAVQKFIDSDMPDQDEEPFVQDNLPQVQGKVEIINVDGVILKHTGLPDEWLDLLGICDLDNVYSQLKAASEDESVDTIVIYFNSPGGQVTGVYEMGNFIAGITKAKQVIGFSDTLCASAAYWLGSQCSAFYCSPSSDVGSVGVYSTRVDYTDAYKQEGVKVNLISAGKFKTWGNPATVMSDEEKTYIQNDVNSLWAVFKEAVQSNRDIKDAYLEGQCFNGTEAVQYNFADGNLDSLDDLVSFLSASQN